MLGTKIEKRENYMQIYSQEVDQKPLQNAPRGVREPRGTKKLGPWTKKLMVTKVGFYFGTPFGNNNYRLYITDRNLFLNRQNELRDNPRAIKPK